MSKNNSGAGGTSPTTVNRCAIDRSAGDSDTNAGFYPTSPRSPYHSTEGGNYKYEKCPGSWGGNVHR